MNIITKIQKNPSVTTKGFLLLIDGGFSHDLLQTDHLLVNHDNKVRELRTLLSDHIRGIVHYEFLPTGQTVNQVYYLEVLKRLREKVRQNRPKLLANNSWILHHNAPVHTALSVREFLATKQITVLEHPAYSLELAPVTFFCSQR